LKVKNVQALRQKHQKSGCARKRLTGVELSEISG